MNKSSAGGKKFSALWLFTTLLVGLALGMGLETLRRQALAANANPGATAKKSIGVTSTSAKGRVGKFANAESAKAAMQHLTNGPGGIAQLRAMLAFADSVDLADVPDLLDLLNDQPTTPESVELKKALLDRWAGANPAAAVAWAEDLKNAGQKTNSLVAIFESWSARDPAAALAAVDAKMSPSVREEALTAVFKNYGAQDPQAALKALKATPAEWGMAGLAQFIYQNWARNDPAAAAADVASMPAGYAKVMSLSRVAEAWTQQDPAAGMAWAQSQLGLGVSWYAVNGLLEQNPAMAGTYLSQLYNGNGRDGLTLGIAHNMAQTDPAAAVDWLDKNATGSAYTKAMTDLVNSFGRDNAAVFAPAVLQMPAGQDRDNAIAHLTEQWTMGDREGALAWAQNLPAAESQAQHAALFGIFDSWSNDDPAAAAKYAQANLAGNPGLASVVQDAMNAWGTYDPAAALAWAQTLNDPAASANAISGMIKGVTAANPQLGAQYAESLPPGDVRNQALANAVVIWGANNPAGAAALLNEIAPGDMQNSTAGQLATRWAKSDPATASQWVNSLPAGPARDAAVEGMITVVGKSDPAGVFNWAASITNETTRLSQLRATVQQWAGTDATAAGNAIQNAANLNIAQKTDLLEAVKNAAAAKKAGTF